MGIERGALGVDAYSKIGYQMSVSVLMGIPSSSTVTRSMTPSRTMLMRWNDHSVTVS